MKLALYLVAGAWILALVGTSDADFVVHTAKGAVQGKLQESSNGRDIYSFMGIPYAKPPVGQLRFQPPEQMEMWSDVYDARQERSDCSQIDAALFGPDPFGEEDCLYLNVYSSHLPSENTQLSPVMVWIHGGAFLFGSGSPTLYSPEYLLNHDIVLVTLNYRLGVLGFLSTGDEVCPGNMGLKDQLKALEWVRDNIERFGGDPNQVTIFGESAGAASVHYHMMSKASRGLFHRAITQSGSAVSRWAYTSPELAKKRAMKVAQDLGCAVENSSQMLKCLRNIDAKKFLFVNPIEGEHLLAFTPTMELSGSDKFLTESPHSVAKRGDLAPVPWISGITADEGAFILAELMVNPEFLPSLEAKYEELFQVLFMSACFTNDPKALSQKMRQFYLSDNAIDAEAIPQLLDLYSDDVINYGVYDAFRQQLAHHAAPMYFYMLSYRGKTSLTELITNSTYNYGVSHADDLMYLFPGEKFFPRFTDDEPEKHMSDIMTDFWTNFAQTGNPTPSDDKWAPSTTGNIRYLDLKLDPEMQPGYPYQNRMDFWDSLSLETDYVGKKLVPHDEF